MSRKYTVNLLGLGYVGGATALHLALRGAQVTAWDIDRERVDAFKAGHLPFPDKDLSEAYSYLMDHFDPEIEFIAADQPKPRAEWWFICVGTPNDSSGKFDLSGLISALKDCCDNIFQTQAMNSKIVIRSTIPPGTLDNLARPIVDSKFRDAKQLEPIVCYFPEFMREGMALEDLKSPPLCILGTEDQVVANDLEVLFGLNKNSMRTTTSGTAEVVKIISNVYHALKVTFANEVGRVCQTINIDSNEVMDVFCSDHKLNISPAYMKPGFAFGGPCLDKDLSGMIGLGEQLQIKLPLFESIRVSNNEHKNIFAKMILSCLKKHQRLLIVGPSFKPGTTDQRNSPILQVKEILDMEMAKNIFVAQELPSDLEGFSAVLLGSLNPSNEALNLLKSYDGLIFDSLTIEFYNNALKGRKNYFSILGGSPKI